MTRKRSLHFCFFLVVLCSSAFAFLPSLYARMARMQDQQAQESEPRIFLKKYTAVPSEGHLIKDVPFYKQKQRNYCGPAVLSMVLNYWQQNETFTQDEIASDIFDASGEITNNSKIVFYPREKGFYVYSFNGDMGTLKTFIDADIPVIILQKVVGKIVNKGHYRIVLGYDDARNLMIVHDPWFGEALSISYNVFSELWAFGKEINKDNWALVILPKEKQNIIDGLGLRESAVTYHNIATALYGRKDISEAIEEWGKAIEISPEEITFYYCIAYAYIQQGNYDEAIRYGKRAVDLDSGNNFALDTLGWAYYKKGMLNEALSELEKAARLNPDVDFIENHYNIIKEEINKFSD
jgi:tetratricopeptide (TPR) repeat protein